MSFVAEGYHPCSVGTRPLAANKGTISYLYDAAGNKLGKTVNETGQAAKTTQYLGGLIFEGNVLQHVATEEGRVRLESGQWRYDYFLKDHLGNVRVMLADNATPLEETHYYPFGLTQRGISYQNTTVPENKKKFNCIEQTQELGLNQYDAFFRTMDPQVGRWWQIDPKPDHAQSLYMAMGNNPITNADYWGDTVRPGAGFWSNVWEGIKEGGRSTKNFVKSLSTAEGWGNALDGMAAMSPFNVDEGAVNSRAAMIDGTVKYVGNIPNMTKDQAGHDLGYGLEKTAEVVVATKGAGAVKNAINTARNAELGSTIGTLREASQGRGNFGLGEASAKKSNQLGNMWVGDNAKVASDGKTIISQDGLKQYRPPASKKSSFATTGVQSNFQSRPMPQGPWQNNGHLNITPAKPFWQFW